MNKNSKIFIAGSTGLVGSAIHKRLKSLDYKKVIITKKESDFL